MTTLLTNLMQANAVPGLATQAYVQTALDQSGPLAGFRNLITNGDFRFAQRGTSGALTNSGTYLSVDRWVGYQGSTANGVLAQVSSGLTGLQYAAKFGRNNGATTTGPVVIGQALETFNSIPVQGQTVTLSFYAKAGANYSGSTFWTNVYTGTGTDQSGATLSIWPGTTNPISQLPALNTTWQRFFYTGLIPSTANQISVQFGWTPTGTAGADDNVYITGVQLEIGSHATPFELRPYQTELALCQRYYEIGSTFYRVCGLTSSVGTTIKFITPKRANTTNVFSGITYTSSSGLADISATYLTALNTAFAFSIVPSVNNGWVSFSWAASAEL